MSGRIRSRALATLLLLALAASPASAAPGWEDLGRAAWRGLMGLFLGDGLLKHGCGIDPDGVAYCMSDPSKGGCGIDPDGVAYCVPEDAMPKPRQQGGQGDGAKHGCGIDPNGKQICW